MSAWEDPVFWSWLITLGSMVLFFLWVVFIHSAKRWPGTGAWERTVAIVTLDGAWMRAMDRAKKNHNDRNESHG